MAVKKIKDKTNLILHFILLILERSQCKTAWNQLHYYLSRPYGHLDDKGYGQEIATGIFRDGCLHI